MVGAILNSPAQHLRQLAVRIGGGDKEAFRQLYRLSASYTLDDIRLELPDPVHSMHVLRGTFCEVWWTLAADARRSVEPPDMSSWMKLVARQRCVERLAGLVTIESEPPEVAMTMIRLMEIHDRSIQTQLAVMLDDAREIVTQQTARPSPTRPEVHGSRVRTRSSYATPDQRAPLQRASAGHRVTFVDAIDTGGDPT
jgi:hypothetical protein